MLLMIHTNSIRFLKFFSSLTQKDAQMRANCRRCHEEGERERKATYTQLHP